MALSRGAKIGIGLGALAGLAALAGGKPKVQQYYVADLGGGPPVLPPPPPTDGQGFRSGPQPHPDFPAEENAGRWWAKLGASSTRYFVSDHDAHLLDLAPNASGSIDVRLYANMVDEPTRCFARSYTIDVDGGRIVQWRIGGKSQATCPQGSVPLLAGLPFTSNVPIIGWESRGPGVWMLWRMTGTHEPIDNNVGFSPESSPAFSFYVDVLWTFE